MAQQMGQKAANCAWKNGRLKGYQSVAFQSKIEKVPRDIRRA